MLIRSDAARLASLRRRLREVLHHLNAVLRLLDKAPAAEPIPWECRASPPDGAAPVPTATNGLLIAALAAGAKESPATPRRFPRSMSPDASMIEWVRDI